MQHWLGVSICWLLRKHKERRMVVSDNAGKHLSNRLCVRCGSSPYAVQQRAQREECARRLREGEE